MINRLDLPWTEQAKSTPQPLRNVGPPGPDLRQWSQPLEAFIAKHPGACLATAVIVGAALAWWIKRR